MKLLIRTAIKVNPFWKKRGWKVLIWQKVKGHFADHLTFIEAIGSCQIDSP